jgi:hypothetical protein
VIWRHWKDKVNLNRFMHPFISPYREGCEYWEFVRILEKTIFFAIRDLAVVGRSLKSLLLFATLIIGHLFDTHIMPFKTAQLNKQYFRYLFGIDSHSYKSFVRWNQLSLVILSSASVFESQNSGKEVLAGVLVFLFALIAASQFLTLRDWFKSRNVANHTPTEVPKHPTTSPAPSIDATLNGRHAKSITIGK